MGDAIRLSATPMGREPSLEKAASTQSHPATDRVSARISDLPCARGRQLARGADRSTKRRENFKKHQRFSRAFCGATRPGKRSTGAGQEPSCLPDMPHAVPDTHTHTRATESSLALRTVDTVVTPHRTGRREGASAQRSFAASLPSWRRRQQRGPVRAVSVVVARVPTTSIQASRRRNWAQVCSIRAAVRQETRVPRFTRQRPAQRDPA